MDRRHRLLITLTLLLAACGGGTHAAPTTPAPAATTGTPPVPTVPTVTEAALDPDTLTTFIRERFPAAVEAGRIELGYGSGGVGDELIEELAIAGITTTTQLAAIVPPDFDTRGFAAISPATNRPSPASSAISSSSTTSAATSPAPGASAGCRPAVTTSWCRMPTASTSPSWRSSGSSAATTTTPAPIERRRGSRYTRGMRSADMRRTVGLGFAALVAALVAAPGCGSKSKPASTPGDGDGDGPATPVITAQTLLGWGLTGRQPRGRDAHHQRLPRGHRSPRRHPELPHGGGGGAVQPGRRQRRRHHHRAVLPARRQGRRVPRGLPRRRRDHRAAPLGRPDDDPAELELSFQEVGRVPVPTGSKVKPAP
ncbi:MAG: hypothetical protein HS111_15160 [Kofleriaceae bacterium]|nr:hypothetical protein [Kofleriaceae bacterium]